MLEGRHYQNAYVTRHYLEHTWMTPGRWTQLGGR
jgi:hypothetical protein